MKKLPNIYELKKAISEFEAIDWRHVTKENINDILPKELYAYPLMTIVLNLKGKYIYRSRPYHTFPSNEDRNQDNIYLPQSFSYPPASKARINRANFEGEPVFYGASSLLTAIVESKTQDNLNFVGCWSINTEKIRIQPFLSNIPSQIQESPSLIIHRIINKLKELLDEWEDKEVINLIYKFNDAQFTKSINSPNDYLYTAWVTYRSLFDYKNKPQLSDTYPHAIMYQSTIDHALGTNIAIHPNVVDNNLSLEKLYLISHSRNTETNKPQTHLLSCGIPKGNIISWNTPSIVERKEFEDIHYK